MADNLNIYKICENCGGNGQVKNTEAITSTNVREYFTECGNCNGTGKYLWGEMKKEPVE